MLGGISSFGPYSSKHCPAPPAPVVDDVVDDVVAEDDDFVEDVVLDEVVLELLVVVLLPPEPESSPHAPMRTKAPAKQDRKRDFCIMSVSQATDGPNRSRSERVQLES